MIVKNSKKEKNTVTFEVELDAAEFEKYVNGAYLKARSRIMVPGFRKGKDVYKRQHHDRRIYIA